MIRDEAALKLAQDLLETFKTEHSAEMVQLTASLIQSRVVGDELQQSVEAMKPGVRE